MDAKAGPDFRIVATFMEKELSEEGDPSNSMPCMLLGQGQLRCNHAKKERGRNGDLFE